VPDAVTFKGRLWGKLQATGEWSGMEWRGCDPAQRWISFRVYRKNPAFGLILYVFEPHRGRRSWPVRVTEVSGQISSEQEEDLLWTTVFFDDQGVPVRTEPPVDDRELLSRTGVVGQAQELMDAVLSCLRQ
jgi:hypothetical protein